MIKANEARALAEENTAFFDIILRDVETKIKEACARGELKLRYSMNTSVTVARKVAAALTDNGFHCIVRTELGLLDQHILDIGW